MLGANFAPFTKGAAMVLKRIQMALNGICLSGHVLAANDVSKIEYSPPEIEFDLLTRFWIFVKTLSLNTSTFSRK